MDAQPFPDYDQPFPDEREQLAQQLFAARGYPFSAWDDEPMWPNLRRDCRYLVDRMWPAILRVHL